VLDHTIYLHTDLADHTILETRLGMCFHRARLFVNLCRLMGVPAREQCGALFGRTHSPGMPQRVMAMSCGYDELIHTWAEFYSPSHGWLPVEFDANDFGQRVLTAANVADDQLRRQWVRETKMYDDYYFGNLDPFRVYASSQANQVPTYPIMHKMRQIDLKRLIMQTRYRLTCDLEIDHQMKEGE
jgi:transglutaminase-like putative cysteine protease